MGAGHDHGLGEVQHEKPLWWAFGLTAAFLVAEVVGGLVTNSLALLSDAAHMATEGSPPFSRTLTRRPIEAMRSVHVEAKEVQCRVQAWRG
ncbi:cation diffusion facilitator family transporter [Luteimonas sp BLCC-B24]|jgi:Co/Zn/Cd efflux system component|nr:MULTISPECIES: cation diffusion facilitator family transporter [Xanthomonadaceae]MDC7808476.1 cation diffusion facilitator family transporter [Luteimonas sp. BLCC-B24]